MWLRIVLALLIVAPLTSLSAQEPPPEPPPEETAPPEQAPPEQAPPEQAPPEQAPPQEAPPPQAAPQQAPPQPAPTEAPPPEAAPAEPTEKQSFWNKLWPKQDEVLPVPEGTTAAQPVPTPTAPRRLAGVQKRLRASRVGTDLVGRRYLDLVDTGTATAGQLNEFGIWLSGQGILEPAEEYFRAALELNDADAEVWNNLGMVQLRLGQDGAKSSFEHAIELVPTHAVAHYNMGIVLDHAGEYDAAVEEYIRALTLDPRLGDPVHNPQVVHNQRLLVVRLGLYERKAKTLGLPMGQAAPKK